jgi:hypothetical protein
MTIRASDMLLATERAMRMQIARDRITVGHGKLREEKAVEFAAAMTAAFAELQRALADRLRSETA